MMKNDQSNQRLPLPQSPSGLMGRLFGKIMEWTNIGAYRRAIETLAPAPNECFLELGFGTGRCAEMLLFTHPDSFVAGIDPTPTMLQTAINRLTNLSLSDHIDLREGTDADLPWEDHKFDAIIAIHCFQFWQDPDRSMAEINRVLHPNGRIVIVFRDHSVNPPAWLPNSLSRSGREIELAIDLLEQHGYVCAEHPAAGSSRIIRADKLSH